MQGVGIFCIEVYSLCSDVVGKNWGDSPLSMLPIYQELIAAGLRIWVFRYETLVYSPLPKSFS